jgi:predicted alpha/beta hydrolase family esterase
MKNILFIQGGGDNGYEAGAKIADVLQGVLGEAYHISYPRLITDETASDFGWIKQIKNEIENAGDSVIIVAHSLGASLLLKYLTENKVITNIAGVFLLAPPFWSGDEDWKQGLKLRPDFPEKLPKNIPFFFYHANDDKEVPQGHFGTYKKLFPVATFQEFESGGHQFTGHIAGIACDIKL